MKIRTLLFDVDGVLVQSKEYFSQKLAREHKIDAEQVLQFFNQHWESIVTGKKDLKSALSSQIESWNWQGSPDELLSYWFATEQNLNTEMHLLIKKLIDKGLSCHLATNQEKYRLQHLIAHSDFSEIFENIYSSCNLGVRKPDIKFFEHIWHDLDEPEKKTVLFWDDSERNVQAAKKFGFKAEKYQDHQQFMQTMKLNHHIYLK